jgi:Ca-activated chloride channel family protein
VRLAPQTTGDTGAVRSAAEATWTVFGDYSLADPLFLLLLPLGLALLAWGRSRRGRVAARVSALPGAALPKTLRQRTVWIPTALQGLAIVLCVIAIARPLRGNVEQTTVSEGVDIALVVDRSSSMLFADLTDDPEVTRFQVVKEVVEDFAVRRMTDREGNADAVCLIPFAFYPQVLCPCTLDADALRNVLRPLEGVEPGGPEDGTAIGVALAKAVAVLKETDAKTKLVVLLTDGVNRIDDISPLEAAELAQTEGIRVYTIHAARYVWKIGFDGIPRPDTRAEPDTSELKEIARLTGGRFYRARDKERLEEIYSEIEELERTEREERRFTQNFDLYPYFLQPAIALYLLAWIAGATVSRRLP